MAATFVSTASSTTASGTTPSVTKPAGTVSGHILTLRILGSDVAFGAGVTYTLPSGFTQIDNTTSVFLGSQTWRQITAWKLAGGSEPASYTVTPSGSAYTELDIQAFSGCDTTTPVADHSANSGTSATATGTGVTAGRDGSMLIHCGASDVGPRTSGPSGFTSREDYDGNVYTDTLSVNTGATGNITSSYTPSQVWNVHLVLLQPPTSGATGTGSAAESQFAASGSGAETFTGTGSGAEQPFAASGAGAAGATGTGSGATQPFGASGAASQAVAGTGSAAGAPFAASGTGVQNASGTGSAAAPPFGASGTGVQNASGTGTAAARSFAASGIGTVGTATFPWLPSAGGGYSVDINGDEVLEMGDAGWELARKNITDATTYLDALVANGINFVIVEAALQAQNAASNYPFSLTTTGSAYAGVNGTADFASPVDAWFANVRAIVDAARDRGILVYLYTFFWGFAGTYWWTDITNGTNDSTRHTNFGTYLMNGHGTFTGFATCDNIRWVDGGDYGDNNGTDPSSTGKTRIAAMIAAMQAVSAAQLRSGDWQAPALATDQSDFASGIDIQLDYNYGNAYPSGSPNPAGWKTYENARRAWIASPRMPPVLKETIYQDSTIPAYSPTPSISDVNTAIWWAYLSGDTAGAITGNEHVWPFTGSWASHLADQSYADMAVMGSLLRARAWIDLVPSEQPIPAGGTLRRLIPSSNGTQSGLPAGYIAAAETSAGHLIIAFAPNTTGGGTQTFTVDCRDLTANANALWVDPHDGTQTTAATGILNSEAAQSFTTPGTNSEGGNNWLLLIETVDPTTGTGSGAESPFAGSGSGTETMTGTGAGAAPPFASSSSGTETFTGTGSAAMPADAATGSGTETFTGTGSGTESPFAASGTGTFTPTAVTGTGSAAMSPFGAVGSSTTLYTVPSFLGLS